MIRLIQISILLSGIISLSNTQAAPLDELLERVKQERSLEKQENAAREKMFHEQRDQQQSLLQKAKQKLIAEESRGEKLKLFYANNEQSIRDARRVLDQNLGQLGELHGVVRQIAGDLRGVINASLISAQFRGRSDLAEILANSKEMPSISQIEELWHLQLQEMVESGRVVTFPATVITGDGDEIQTSVTRIGPFTATTEGRFLRYLADTSKMVEPRRQPPLRFQQMALQLEQAEQGPVLMAVDPTRGAMLALLINAPDLGERIRQGGVIGYIILGLGVIGLLIALERFISLTILAGRVRRQRKSPEPNLKNPLGRILNVYSENPDVDAETLGLKLDEAILKELPRVQRGLGTLSVLAAISPLLGLLGTVTGIIETFQAITLYGTGDPRMMSGGISQALVTTVQGLVVAIPLLLLHSFLASKSSQIVQTLDEQSAALVAHLAERKTR